MTWFRRVRSPRIGSGEKRLRIPEGLWVRCNGCKEIVYKREVVNQQHVCPKCQYHFHLGAWERIALLMDPHSFKEHDTHLVSRDPLRFKDTLRYTDRIKAASKKLGMNDAVICGEGCITGQAVQLCAFEFDFMGGSMASVVGEKLTRAVERAATRSMPLIIVSCSGGARMQEGIFSLMQMAKIAASLTTLARARVPYLSILTDPTTGGVTASFAMLGDVIMAEPGALIGFAGPRVIEQTIRQKLPEGFQRAEFLLQHGLIDMVVPRRDLRPTLSRVLQFFA